MADLKGIVVTHNHIDHVKGLEVISRHYPDLPIFANWMTAEASANLLKMDPESFYPFENGQSFEVGPFEVEAFPIPHDVPDPVGYTIKAEGLVYFHATDVGTALDSIGERLAEADFATLESNHDPVMVMESGRPLSLKERILGPRGHLSNDDAAGLVKRFASPKLKELRLAHLSESCNMPHMAEAAMREALAEIDRTDVLLTVLPARDIL